MSVLSIKSFAQVVCCPDFYLKDAVEICASDFACSNTSPAGGQGHAMVACKLSAHTYTVYPNTAPYIYTWTVSGGTPTNFTGNPNTILWGSGTTGFIKVVISGGGCLDSIVQQICLIDGPKANFTAVPNPVCTGGLVHFTNNSTGGGSYLWDFGDGTTSTLANPPDHNYISAGFYTVILTATDMGPAKQGTDQRTPCGCSDTASVIIQVKNGVGPSIDKTCCFGTVCPGDTSSFCTTLVCGTYNWTVAGGSIISGAGTSCIKIKWDAVYTVPTTVTLSAPCTSGTCPGSTTLNVPVLYPNLPISGPNPLCVGSSGSFFLPSMPGTYYSWTTTAPAGTYSFNDKDRNVANVNMTFNLAGTYQIKCIYTNPLAGCSGTSIFNLNVLPVFSISGSELVCQYSSPTYFASAAANWVVTPVGAFVPPGSGISKIITWNTPGTYLITATPTVAGVYCNPNAIKIVQVVAIPILGPIVGPTLVCPDKNSTFSITSNKPGNPFTWLITSGTGTIQTQFGADKDSAIIKLTGTGPSWTIGVYQEIEISPGVLCQSLTQTLVVNRYGAPTVTGPPVVCVDAITTFTATGPTPPGGYQWSILPPFSNRGTVIGPQGLSTANIRWHGPPAVGVIVVASNCGGSGSTAVTIANPPAIPVITANGSLTYCLPALPATGFTLSVPNIYSSYQWYGPAGLVSGATNASYTPAAGTFPPAGGSFIFTVVVSNGICSVSAKVQVLIGTCSGTGLPPNPITCAIDFIPPTVCVNQPATFTAVPGGVFTYQWDFGDGATSFESPTQHSYLSAGTYSVTVTATLGTCVATKVHSVTVNPSPVCSITVLPDTMFCPGSSVTFSGCTGMSSYQWYKDGNLITGATSINYNATQHGEYWLEVTNSFGCPYTSNHIYIYKKALPKAKITGNGLVCSYPGAVESLQLSAYYNANYSYFWSSNPTGATFTPNNSNASFMTTASITLPAVLPYTCAFYVKVTDLVTGCENRDTLCVTFFQTPSLTVSATYFSGCEGTPDTLKPNPNNPGLYHYQWSNGKTTPSIIVKAAGTYSLTMTDKKTGCSVTALAAMIHPKPDLSLFPRGCDTICDTASFHLYIPLPLTALPPLDTYAGAYPVIKWFDNGNYATPVGTGQNLIFTSVVLGSHQISVVVGNSYGCYDTAGVFCLNVRHCERFNGLDFGDAPENTSGTYNYQTLLPNGARHKIVPGVYLGAKIDAEKNGQPSIGADCDDNDCAGPSGGDDEDGVTMPAVIEIGNTINISVQASVAGFLDLWIDYNVNGNWTGPGEHVFTTLPIVSGANALSFIVPATATVGQSYARFRFRTTNPPISFNGLVSDGEVEDYPVYIDECSQGTEMDFGDAPDLPTVGFNYPTLLASNGARHVKYLNIRLGALIDAEPNGQPNALALGDDLSALADEDGVQFVGTMYVGLPANIKVTASVPGFLNAWMDFNKDGDWADPGEQIFTNQPLSAGVNNLTFTIPTTAQQGKTYSRFRFNTIGGLNYYGLALNGEVEDYQVHACPYWWPVHTNLKHYITIPHNLPNLHAGDVLGVFYTDANGLKVCGGLSEFNGTDDQMMIAYGDDPATPVKDGFVVGEPITWKLCSVVKGDANPIDVTYDFTYPSHNGLFTVNGLSALSGINGLNVVASATPGTICNGEAVQLHADVGAADGVSFIWRSLPSGFNSDQRNPVANPTGNTSYIVDAFDGVFHAYDTVTVTVTQVNPLVELLPLNNITIPSSQSSCYNATMVITVAGNGTTFIVENGGSVQMIAGQKISLLPGTKGNSGSYLHAMITSTGAYCCNTTPPAPAIMNNVPTQPDANKPFYKVYPNPTNGAFTIELNGIAESANVSVEIYGILGERILKTDMHGSRQQVFDLSGRQHGIYLVRLTYGKELGMTKIIKQ
ncbi:MAG: GEVED domain-containing protein [Bacteroidota bacterium]